MTQIIDIQKDTVSLLREYAMRTSGGTLPGTGLRDLLEFVNMLMYDDRQGYALTVIEGNKTAGKSFSLAEAFDAAAKKQKLSGEIEAKITNEQAKSLEEVRQFMISKKVLSNESQLGEVIGILAHFSRDILNATQGNGRALGERDKMGQLFERQITGFNFF